MAWLFTCLSRLPLSVLYWIGGAAYLVLYKLLGVRKQVVLENLANSFPQWGAAEVAKTAGEFYRNYTDVLMEMVKSITMSKEEILHRVRIGNPELIENELERGQPVLLTVAHQCNIEWLLLGLCCRLGYPTEAIYRPIGDPTVERIATEAYTRFGGTLMDDRSVVREIMQRRNEPRIVAIASDQAPNINDEKIWVRFLNQDTAFFLAPDTIARFVSYPVYFAAITRTARGYYEVTFNMIARPPYMNEEKTVAKAYIEAVEKQILSSPEDWLWMHRRWKRKRSVYD